MRPPAAHPASAEPSASVSERGEAVDRGVLDGAPASAPPPRDPSRAGTFGEPFLRAVLERLPIGVVLVDTESGRILLVNAAADAITGGYPRDVPPDHQDAVFATDASGRRLSAQELPRFRVARERLEGWEVTWHNMGKVTTVRMHSETLPATADGPAVTVLTLRDVTAARRAERALVESEDRFRAIFELAPVGIAQAELDGRFVAVNAELARITGVPREALLGTSFLDVTHPDDRGADRERFERLVRGEIPYYAATKRYLRPDGSIAWVEVSVAMLRRATGEPLRTVGVIRDVTAERAAAERLGVAQRDLERLTAELLRAQDDERRRIARELHDGAAQYVFAAQLELARMRQPLGDEPRQQAVERADALCRDAVRSLRTMSYVLHPPALDAGLAAGARWCVEGFANRTGIDASVECDGERRLPAALELALFRVLQESLTNVQRHAGARSVRVTLALGEREAVLAIRDDGRGLPPPASLRAGVGIAGMRERLRALGGTLELESGGWGTEVRARVPAPVADEAPTP